MGVSKSVGLPHREGKYRIQPWTFPGLRVEVKRGEACFYPLMRRGERRSELLGGDLKEVMDAVGL